MMTKRHFRLKAVPNSVREHEQHLDEKPLKVDFAYAALGALIMAGLVALLVFGMGAINAHFINVESKAKQTVKVAEPLGVLIDRVSTEVGLHPVLAHALVDQESSKNKNAVSSTGAIGLTQVLWSTAKGEGVESLTDLTIPETNLRTGFKYLLKQKANFKTWWNALLAYKVGPGAVKRGHKATAEDIKYISSILAKCKHVMKEI